MTGDLRRPKSAVHRPGEGGLTSELHRQRFASESGQQRLKFRKAGGGDCQLERSRTRTEIAGAAQLGARSRDVRSRECHLTG